MVNMGRIDRAIRVAVAAIIGIAWIAGWLHGALAVVLGIIGVVMVVTSAVGYCPAYTLFGISTCPKPAAPPTAAKEGQEPKIPA